MLTARFQTTVMCPFGFSLFIIIYLSNLIKLKFGDYIMSEVSSGLNKKLIFAVLFIIIIAGGVAGYYFLMMPGGGGGPQQQQGITIKIITRHDTTIWREFENAFLQTQIAKDYNITDIDWVSPDPGLWDDVINQGGIDVAWGGGPTLFDELIRDGLLAPLTEDIVLEQVNQINDTIAGAPMKRFGSNNEILWVAAAISTFGFTINTAFLQENNLPTPSTWDNLSSPVFGKLLPTPTIAMGNAPGTTSNTRIYEIILQAFGWEQGWNILTRMAGNARIYSGSVETQSAVESGEVGVAMSIDFYGYTSQLVNPDCKYVLPKGQSIVNGDPIALVKNAPHSKAAQAFIAWVLSPEGQSHWLVRQINRMPVRADAFDTPLGKQRPDLKELYNETIHNIGIPFNDSLALSYEETMRYYFEAVLTNAHDQLVAAWKEIAQAYLRGDINQTQYEYLIGILGKPVSWTENGQTYTFSQSYAQSIENRIRTDSAFREHMQSLWTEAAIAQYQEALNQLNQMLGG